MAKESEIDYNKKALAGLGIYYSKIVDTLDLCE